LKFFQVLQAKEQSIGSIKTNPMWIGTSADPRDLQTKESAEEQNYLTHSEPKPRSAHRIFAVVRTADL